MKFEQIKQQVTDAAQKCQGNAGVIILADAMLKLMNTLEPQQDWPNPNEGQRILAMQEDSITRDQLAQFVWTDQLSMSKRECEQFASNLLSEFDIREKM